MEICITNSNRIIKYAGGEIKSKDFKVGVGQLDAHLISSVYILVS